MFDAMFCAARGEGRSFHDGGEGIHVLMVGKHLELAVVEARRHRWHPFHRLHHGRRAQPDPGRQYPDTIPLFSTRLHRRRSAHWVSSLRRRGGRSTLRRLRTCLGETSSLSARHDIAGGIQRMGWRQSELWQPVMGAHRPGHCCGAF